MPYVRSTPRLMQKNSLYIIRFIFLFSFLVVSTPSVVVAKDPNVNDWLMDKEPAGQSTIEEKEERVELKTTNDKSLVLIIGQLIFYTLLILVMIYGLIKFLAVRQKNLQPNQAVQLMGGTPLGNNKSLQLVKVGGQVLLIGVGDQVTLIKEFSSTDEMDFIEKDIEKQPTLFSSSLFNFPKGKPINRIKKNPPRGFEHLFTQSLDKQKDKQDRLDQDLNQPDSKKEGYTP